MTNTNGQGKSVKKSSPRGAGKAAASGATPRSGSGTKASATTTKAAAKAPKVQKVKLVRDGFTIPEDEYAQLAELKKRFLAQGLAVKKTEILRAALKAFAALSDARAIQAVQQLPVIKAGRPGKDA